MYNIHSLPASFGDSIFIEYGEAGDEHYILIDGGPYYAFEGIITAIRRIAPGLKKIELLVITHIDIDHIDGIVKLLNRDDLPFEIRQVWFNGWKEIQAIQQEDDDTLGAVQGEYLTHLITKKHFNHNESFGGKAVVIKDYAALPEINLDGGMKLTLLSPGKTALKKLVPVWEKEVTEKIADMDLIEERLKEDHRYESDDDLLGELTIEEMQETQPAGDKSAANGSSIAFLAAFDGKVSLLAADAPSHYLLQAIDSMLTAEGMERLNLDAWKLAHHGSKKSTLDKLMKKIDCSKILISSDGKKYKHPDKECIAKLLKHNGPQLELYFNYRSEHNEMWDDGALKSKYHYEAIYPEIEEESWATVRLQ